MDKDIKKAEEKLEYLSSDPVTMELYFERERALHEKANLISTGIRQEKLDTIIRLYSIGLNTSQISQGVDLSEEEVKEVINNNIN